MPNHDRERPATTDPKTTVPDQGKTPPPQDTRDVRNPPTDNDQQDRGRSGRGG